MSKIDQWKQVVSEARESGLSQRQYCREHGINVSTLNYWKRRIRQSAASSLSGTGLVRVPAQIPLRTSEIVIEVDNRYRLTVPEGTSTEHVRRVLAALR